MAEEQFELEKTEQLQLENLLLREELVRRDAGALESQKQSYMSYLLSKHNVDPKKDKYELTKTHLKVTRSTAAGKDETDNDSLNEQIASVMNGPEGKEALKKALETAVKAGVPSLNS